MTNTTLEQLRKEVEEYLTTNTYEGYSRPFKIGSLRMNMNSRGILELIPEGLPEEDIRVIDTNWEKGLAEIGKRFKTNIGLATHLYAK